MKKATGTAIATLHMMVFTINPQRIVSKVKENTSPYEDGDEDEDEDDEH